jgi:hypothetical protein
MCWLYPHFGDFDSKLTDFRKMTGPDLNLDNATHRKALLEWLNSWGCRQFAKKDHIIASKSLASWGKDFVPRLPKKEEELWNLSEDKLNSANEAYNRLRDMHASNKCRMSQKCRVTFGPTGAAKVLFALRPEVFVPWDDAIRKELKFKQYRDFLLKSQNEIRELIADAERLSIKPVNIPIAVKRPGSTLPKLVDEYNWVKIVKKVEMPDDKTIRDWISWRGNNPRADN